MNESTHRNKGQQSDHPLSYSFALGLVKVNTLQNRDRPLDGHGSTQPAIHVREQFQERFDHEAPIAKHCSTDGHIHLSADQKPELGSEDADGEK